MDTRNKSKNGRSKAGIITEDNISGNEDYSNENNPENTTASGTGTTDSTSGGSSTETTLKPPKRHRGRPKGSKNKNQETISFQEKETVNSDGTTTPKYVPKNKKSKFLSDEECEQTAEFIISTVNDLASNFIDDSAKMNMLETTLIGLALPKYLATLETSSIEKGSKLLYPLMGILGVTVYGIRVASIIVDKSREANAAKKKQNLKPFDENNNYSSDDNTNPFDEHTNGNEDYQEGKDIQWDYHRQNLTTAIHNPI